MQIQIYQNKIKEFVQSDYLLTQNKETTESQYKENHMKSKKTKKI